MNQPVQGGISDGGISDMIMPVFYGELTGDKGRDIAVAVFDYLLLNPSMSRKPGWAPTATPCSFANITVFLITRGSPA